MCFHPIPDEIVMLDIYKKLTKRAAPVLEWALRRRVRLAKEIPDRFLEKMGITKIPRPDGFLIMLHAASVGEAQSSLVLINAILRIRPDAFFLVTTGTAASARTLEKTLPERAFHQFYPWDHPEWVNRFLNYWRPDLAIWMESELWPNMLSEIKSRGIPAVLVNARLSDKSYRRWKNMRNAAREILSAFSLVLAQTQKECDRFLTLGAVRAVPIDNLKYAAKPLPFDDAELQNIAGHMRGRPIWVFASTHAGEESMACRVHQRLKLSIPDVLTIIVPRHPDRRDNLGIENDARGLKIVFRGDDKKPPLEDTDIYIADTFGELGLFYRLAPVACIGRSFSADGGGGHNPIEAAQLRCAVLHGPNVQYQQAIYDEMDAANAIMMAINELSLMNEVRLLLTDSDYRARRQEAAYSFAVSKASVIDRVMENVAPYIEVKP
jgi:3-deoxy-D-manno-octulosonic-acid transferase